MAWATGAARGIVKDGKPIEFIAPTGFPIRQPHRVEAPALVGTVLMGTFRQIVTWCDKPEIDKKRQAAALAPNIIHA
jgi:DNA-directed RNA polymerase